MFILDSTGNTLINTDQVLWFGVEESIVHSDTFEIVAAMHGLSSAESIVRDDGTTHTEYAAPRMHLKDQYPDRATAQEALEELQSIIIQTERNRAARVTGFEQVVEAIKELTVLRTSCDDGASAEDTKDSNGAWRNSDVVIKEYYSRYDWLPATYIIPEGLPLSGTIKAKIKEAMWREVQEYVGMVLQCSRQDALDCNLVVSYYKEQNAISVASAVNNIGHADVHIISLKKEEA